MVSGDLLRERRERNGVESRSYGFRREAAKGFVRGKDACSLTCMQRDVGCQFSFRVS